MWNLQQITLHYVHPLVTYGTTVKPVKLQHLINADLNISAYLFFYLWEGSFFYINICLNWIQWFTNYIFHCTQLYYQQSSHTVTVSKDGSYTKRRKHHHDNWDWLGICSSVYHRKPAVRQMRHQNCVGAPSQGKAHLVDCGSTWAGLKNVAAAHFNTVSAEMIQILLLPLDVYSSGTGLDSWTGTPRVSMCVTETEEGLCPAEASRSCSGQIYNISV